MDIDYEKLKFKSGLEIHQQLDSGKLFCDCPSVLRSDDPDFEVSRRLHAIAGETGEIDIAVKHQAGKNKEFVYQVHKENVCLVDLDEEPPHKINKDALDIAVQIGLLMNMKIFPITQIMRKTVVDGSNTSGFQRTVMIARDGFIETSYGKVEIDYLFLEEDSARIIKRGEDKDIYRLDRLGFPLVEVVTAPDFKNTKQAKEAALKIGEILRSCKVKRGIGTIRQDLNISIRDENRIEIKGMQDMKIFEKAAEIEVLRQEKLSDKKNPVDMEVRNVLKDGSSEFLRPLPGSSRMYPETDLPLLKISRKFIDDAKKRLPKLRSVIERDLKKKGLSEDMIMLLFKQNKIEEFKTFLEILNSPQFVAKVLLIFLKDVSVKKNFEIEILEDYLSEIFLSVANGDLREENVKSALEGLTEGKVLKDILKERNVNNGDIEEKIMKIINAKPGLSEKAYMGLVMKEFRGKVSGKESMEMIKKLIG